MADIMNNTIGSDSYSTSAGASAAPTPAQSIATANVVYAGFFQRFVASLIDAILVGLVTGVISAVFGAMGDFGKSLGSLVSLAISCVYYVYFISQKGQTLGKQALGIRVQNVETGQNLDVVSAILREVVGKFISSLILLLGYFWMLWDPNKQTWHDKIAKSVVVKVK